MDYIWVFNGNGNSPFLSGIFTSKQNAEKWISKNNLSGTLTRCPLDISLYDWAIQNDYFAPKNEMQKTPLFIQNFTCASAEHYHYAEGELD